MRQPDPCGCGGIVTPTLEQLLAVARNKPLPRVKVRERRPPPARVGATLKGWLSWQLIDRRGREVRAGEGPNLILDQGLDEIAVTEILAQAGNLGITSTYFPIIRYAAVGTDSTSPATSQTGLGAELARTDTTYATETFERPSPGVYQLTRFIEFDYDEGNGVLAEWGFSSSSSVGANLFNRALFLDGGGSPDAITKTDQEKLRLAYTLEITLSPVTLTAGSFDITGVGTVNGDYTLLGSGAPTSLTERCKAPDLVMFSTWARGIVGVADVSRATQPPVTGTIYVHDVDLSTVAYTNEVTKTEDVNTRRAPRDYDEERDAYVTGSFERTGGTWWWDTGYGNLDPIRGFYVQGTYENFSGGVQQCGRAGYAFALDPGDVFTKDDEHTLTIGVPTVSWGRAS